MSIKFCGQKIHKMMFIAVVQNFDENLLAKWSDLKEGEKLAR